MKAKLVPACVLYFAWSGIPETKPEHGPFLNMKELKDYIQEVKPMRTEENKDNGGDQIMSWKRESGKFKIGYQVDG